jgi:GT2 family glycosyltransferase
MSLSIETASAASPAEDVAAVATWPRTAGAPEAGAVAPGVTLAVCTFARPKSLMRLLDSVAAQEPTFRELVIVDASPDDASERALAARSDHPRLASRVRYYRVQGGLRGLTRQRRFAVRHLSTDLVLFCDDDVVLLPGCAASLLEAFRAGGESIAGAGAFLENEVERPSRRWRMRRVLGIVPSLRPGRYHASGFSTPWRFLQPTEAVVDGDWIPGAVMLWRSRLVRDVGFDPEFEGYGNGEDLDFSLRARRHGRLVVVGKARALHLREESGRPDSEALGYQSLRNSWIIHRRNTAERGTRAVAWFVWAAAADALVRAADLLRPGRGRVAAGFLKGEWRFLRESLRARSRA